MTDLDSVRDNLTRILLGGPSSNRTGEYRFVFDDFWSLALSQFPENQIADLRRCHQARPDPGPILAVRQHRAHLYMKAPAVSIAHLNVRSTHPGHRLRLAFTLRPDGVEIKLDLTPRPDIPMWPSVGLVCVAPEVHRGRTTGWYIGAIGSTQPRLVRLARAAAMDCVIAEIAAHRL